MALTRPRPYRPDDLPSVCALVNACALGGEANVAAKTRESLASEIEAPSVDPLADLCVWTAEGEAQPRAFARVDLDPVDDELHGRLYYAIARHEDAALEHDIWVWAATRIRAAAGDRRARLVHAVDVQDPARGDRLVAAGFHRFRTYLVLGRELADASSEGFAALAAPPPHFEIRGCRPHADAHAYVGIYNLAFADAFRFTPLAADDFLHDTESPSYEAELDLVLVDASQHIVGFCFAEIDREHPTLGHVASLGVHPDLRRLGLAESLLRESLRRLAARGALRAHLFVDADSPTGATRLYARVGFTQLYAQRRYELDDIALTRLAALR